MVAVKPFALFLRLQSGFACDNPVRWSDAPVGIDQTDAYGLPWSGA